MKHIAQCRSLAEVRDNIAPIVVQASWPAMIAAFVQAEREAHAALHPPSPTKN